MQVVLREEGEVVIDDGIDGCVHCLHLSLSVGSLVVLCV